VGKGEDHDGQGNHSPVTNFQGGKEQQEVGRENLKGKFLKKGGLVEVEMEMGGGIPFVCLAGFQPLRR